MNKAHSFIFCVLLVCCIQYSSACGPGRGGIRRANRKLTPLVYKQHVPNFSERSLAASGPFRERVGRQSQAFKFFRPNQNEDIIFKDEERTGADRLMTRRCMEKLNTLAISVMNQWPGIQLRVTEAWDEDAHHSHQSLHYEGRAVDITTSDRDRTKYGLLARLAVEAGFDWVYYESKSHIHASCKTEATDTSMGGCFPETSWVRTAYGEKMRLDQLDIGDEILCIDQNGQFTLSPVIAFLHRSPNEKKTFIQIETDSGHTLSITPKHLIFVPEDKHINDLDQSGSSGIVAQMAREVQIGQDILIQDNAKQFRSAKVVQINVVIERGLYAPLTEEGTVIVNDILASSYSHVNSHYIAHAAFLPMRLFYNLRSHYSTGHANRLSPPTHSEVNEKTGDGIHWYARLLVYFGNRFLDDDVDDWVP